MAEKILSIKATAEKIGASRISIYSWVQKGIFPRPIQIGPRRIGWLQSELDLWISSKVAVRDAVSKQAEPREAAQ